MPLSQLVVVLDGMQLLQLVPFFAWLPVPVGFTSEEFADYLLEQADVAVAAGNGFGEYGEGYIRVGLLMDEDRLVEAVERINNLNLF